MLALVVMVAVFVEAITNQDREKRAPRIKDHEQEAFKVIGVIELEIGISDFKSISCTVDDQHQLIIMIKLPYYTQSDQPHSKISSGNVRGIQMYFASICVNVIQEFIATVFKTFHT